MEDSEPLDTEGCRRLAQAVVIFCLEKRTGKRYQFNGKSRSVKVPDRLRRKAEAVFESEEFETWCDLAGIDLQRLQASVTAQVRPS